MGGTPPSQTPPPLPRPRPKSQHLLPLISPPPATVPCQAKDITDSDRGCMRFLIARQFNVPAAAQMLMSAVVWRHDNQLDTILDMPKPTVHAIGQLFGEGRGHKYDRLGRPVIMNQVCVAGAITRFRCPKTRGTFDHRMRDFALFNVVSRKIC